MDNAVNSAELPVTVTAVSENAILLEWPENVCPRQHQHIINCRDQIHKHLAQQLIDIVASYNSLMIYYRLEQMPLVSTTYSATDNTTNSTTNSIKNQLIAIIKNTEEMPVTNRQETQIEIPVYYGPEAGWDLDFVAGKTSMTIAQVIHLHQAQSYRAYALGFTPGFCYLGSLPPQLQLARRSVPRVAMPKGAVAIASLQTAVYPSPSPGGWHILGQTPIAMYKLTGEVFQPLITLGQQIRFTSIDLQTFKEMDGKLSREKT